jgi:hypothetical protein
MPSTATITGSVGPGIAITSSVFTNIVRMDFDTVNEVLTLYMSDKAPAYVNIAACTTLTLTVVAPNNYTLTIT